MIRTAALIAVALVTAAEAPVHGTGKCDASRVRMFVGALATTDIGTAALKRSRARVIRWLPPETMVTMDFRQDRLTLRLDRANYITGIACG